MSDLKVNPHTHCIKCGHSYSVADEACQQCGFDPIDGKADEDDQDLAILRYERDLRAIGDRSVN
jgi:predicted  nucleic acid-binding Zn-ribbon protein